MSAVSERIKRKPEEEDSLSDLQVEKKRRLNALKKQKQKERKRQAKQHALTTLSVPKVVPQLLPVNQVAARSKCLFSSHFSFFLIWPVGCDDFGASL